MLQAGMRDWRWWDGRTKEAKWQPVCGQLPSVRVLRVLWYNRRKIMAEEAKYARGCMNAELRYSPTTALSRLLASLFFSTLSQPASQLGTQAGDCATMRACTPAGGVCVREQRTRTQTYLTDALLLQCCLAHADAEDAVNALFSALHTAGVQFRMQLCGRACRNWTLACLACYSARLLRRQTRCSDRRSIPSRRSVCLRCCCPPGAAAARKISVFVSSNESMAASMIEMPDVQSVVRAAVSNTTRGPFAQPPSCNWA